MKNKISTIIFDMDGVISDTQHLHEQANAEILKEYSIVIDEKEAAGYVGIPTARCFQMIFQKRGLPESAMKEALEKNNMLVRKILSEKAEPIDGSPELISNIKKSGYKTAVASSTDTDMIKITLEKIGVFDKFDKIISGYAIKNPKPAPDIFLMTARELGVEPCECMVIEDAANGAKAAKSAGMKCIGFISPHSGNQDLSMADAIVDDLKKINIDLIKKL